MKTCTRFFLCCCLAACATREPLHFQMGRHEAARLRDSYSRWLAERPRKIAVMEVPATALSKEARDAGFREGAVDSQVVLLWTIIGEEQTEGLVFGRLSAKEVEGLKSLGFSLEPTGTSDVSKFSLQAKK